MIDHIVIHVSDVEKSKKFYTEALKPLGYTFLSEHPEWNLIGLGMSEERKQLWIVGDGAEKATHVGFLADGKETVRHFYDAGLANGGTDNGAPGYRKGYSPGYYAAFVTDPDGHNIEALFRDPNGTPAE
jgi:catechol 2,3-dioxygenase-like lactoylglutathione lyase family enzyme